MSLEKEDIITGNEVYQCKSCGAALKYKPENNTLCCEYCGENAAIEIKPVEEAEEIDYFLYKDLQDNMKNYASTKIMHCSKCGAESTFDESLKAMICPYCTNPLIEADIYDERLLQPSYMLPFSVSETDLKEYLDKWLKGLWFAPNKLKKRALYSQSLKGLYIPNWTYDAFTSSNYSGRRGDYYYVTVGSGDKKRRERRTRWSSVSGTVRLSFDDVLISASKIITPTVMSQIGNWDLKRLVQVDERFMSGFITEKYNVKLNAGFERAKEKMAEDIRYAVKGDIGGDEQDINNISTTYRNITFKLILLPVYMSSYTYKDKLYHFYANGRTGKITGDRPYSTIKIIFFILFCIGVAFLLYYLFTTQ